jgi:drug/metabolite transporter (DMT)-like permease
VVYSKRLREAGLSPQPVLAVRFFPTLAVTRTLTGLSAKPQLAATFPPALFIAVIGAAIPLYLLQAGIKHTEPITAAIVPSLPPLAAYLLPLPAGQLKAPALTLAGVLAIVILVARHDARNGSSSASQSAAAAADPSQATRTR